MWKRIVLYTLLGVVLLAAAGFSYLYFRKPAMAAPLDIQVELTPERIARGKYLFEVVANCDVCHSEHDFTRFGAPIVVSGRGKGGPFPEDDLPGKVYAPNITPDPETGIGNWTDGEKIRAIREGVSRDGRALFPLMPYPAFRHMSDEDVYAIVAYLNTLPPVRNPVPTTELDFPVWMLIKGEPRPVGRAVPPPDRSKKQLYGEYLVTLAECEVCHTPGEGPSMDLSKRFAGGRRFGFQGMEVYSANISPDPETGIGKWSKQRFMDRIKWYRTYVETGSPDAGPEKFTVMPWLHFSQMEDEDLEAIYTYLQSRTPVHNRVEPHPSQKDDPGNVSE
ncbi:MAG: c-type cytochrome [Bryobacteraceae bacterium]